MTTPKAIIQRMIDLLSEDVIGRSASVTALAAGSVTAASLAYGSHSDQKFQQKYVWRPDTATDADRDRWATSWTKSTGLIAHDGANYGDTTITGETVFLLNEDPKHHRRRVNEIVQRVRQYDETFIPLRRGVRDYWITLPWLLSPRDVRGLWVNNDPWLTQNRYLQKRFTVDTSGLLQPSDWTVSNNSDTTPYETTQPTWRGNKYSYSVTDSGTDPTVAQTIDVLTTGVDDDSLVGETIGVYGRFRGSGTSLTLSLADGTTTTTATSTGTGEWEAVATTATIGSEDSLTVTATVGSSATWLIGEMGMHFGSLTDAIRNPRYEREILPRGCFAFEQAGVLRIHLSDYFMTFPGQLVIASYRPYPAFDSARILSGAMDTDTTDADEVTVAVGCLWKLFEAKAAGDQKNPDFFEAEKWKAEFARLTSGQMYSPTEGGKIMFTAPLAPAPVRPW